MPLTKRASAVDTRAIEVKNSDGKTIESFGNTPAPFVAGAQIVEHKPMTKDDYWRNRENRDIETCIRIRRSGVIQAAAMSIASSQYNLGGTIDTYADVVEKLAERMLVWINK